MLTNPGIGGNVSRHMLLLICLLLSVIPAIAQDRHRPDNTPRGAREIELAITALDLKPGATVAEIGAGDARFSFRFSEVVGESGRVYANELGAAKVRRIRDAAERRAIGNLTVIEGGVDDARLPEDCCDAMMMRHVYHMLTQPEPMAKSFFRALKPGGALLILEGDPQPGRRNAAGVPDNRAGMGIDPQIVIDELKAVGFEFDRRVPDWVGSDYALLFRKPRRMPAHDSDTGPISHGCSIR